MAIDAAAVLKSTRDSCLDRGASQNEATKQSNTTIIVAAGGPNSRTAANTNASETDSRAGTLGMRTVKLPLRSVKPASRNHR